MTAATPGSVAVMMMLLLIFVCQSDDKNEGVKNIDDGEEGSHHVPAAAAPAGGFAGRMKRFSAEDEHVTKTPTKTQARSSPIL